MSDFLFEQMQSERKQAEKYWEKVISKWRQDYHKANDTQLYRNKANDRGQLNKEHILEEEKGDTPLKEYLVQETLKDLSKIKGFREAIKNTQLSGFNNSLSDDDINFLIDASYERVPQQSL